MNPHIISPIGATVHETHDEEITQLCEVEHIRLQEAIWQGNLRLCKLEKDQVWLRKKRILMEAEVKRLENEIKGACLIDKPRMTRQGADDHTNELEDYH